MNIEFIEFYLEEIDSGRGTLRGTLHLRFPDIGVSVRGVYVCRSKGDRWFFAMPGRLTAHHETGEKVRYPNISFDDKEKNAELMTMLREKAPDFIEQRLARKEEPIASLQEVEKQPSQAKPLSAEKISTATRKMALIEKNNPRHNLPSKQWVDVAPRKGK